jgi:hypothetical protein
MGLTNSPYLCFYGNVMELCQEQKSRPHSSKGDDNMPGNHRYIYLTCADARGYINCYRRHSGTAMTSILVLQPALLPAH